MQQRRLGNSDFYLSAISLGCMGILPTPVLLSMQRQKLQRAPLPKGIFSMLSWDVATTAPSLQILFRPTAREL